MKKKYINLENIFVRHPIIYKNNEVLDLKIFRNKEYFIEHPKWDKSTVYVQLRISDCLHSLFLNDTKNYRQYYEFYISMTNQKEHSVDKFIEIFNKFDLNQLKKNKVLLESGNLFRKNRYIVLDGAHRLSIYYKKINNKILMSDYFEIKKH